MSIQCQICNQIFKQISSTHLKKHNITVSEYKKIHGAVVSNEYRLAQSKRNSGINNPNFGNRMTTTSKKLISEKNKGNVAHNKGKAMSSTQKANLSAKAIKRNREWNDTDTHPIRGQRRSAETKQKIADKRKEQVITSEQARKAIATRMANGYDIAFFRGKKHTSESKKKISTKSIENQKIKTEIAIKASNTRLAEYGYTLVTCDGNLMTVQCDKCTTQFSRTRQYSTLSKIRKDMCPGCYPAASTSHAEREIADFLEQYTTVDRNNRTILNGKELDIYLPEFDLGIEYSGLYWHSEIHKERNYHIDKTNNCNNQNIRLVHIFEDEWHTNKDIVKSRLLNAIGKSSEQLYARKCNVSAITASSANEFIKENHIQGTGRANVHLGLHYNDKLVAVMTFLNGDISKKLAGWELNRFCNKLNTNVVGGASKLFKYFVRNYSPEEITSFADRRWSATSPFYTNIGFTKQHTSPPNYWYVIPTEMHRIHRFKLRKPPGSVLTERELRESEGYLRIYDCGSDKFVWKRNVS